MDRLRLLGILVVGLALSGCSKAPAADYRLAEARSAGVVALATFERYAPPDAVPVRDVQLQEAPPAAPTGRESSDATSGLVVVPASLLTPIGEMSKRVGAAAPYPAWSPGYEPAAPETELAAAGDVVCEGNKCRRVVDGSARATPLRDIVDTLRGARWRRLSGRR